VGRFLILLLILLGVGLYLPRTRETILTTARPLMAPVNRWMTNQELTRISEDLEILEGSEGALPIRRGEFDAWLERRYPQEASRVDAWGTRYRLEVSLSSFRVVSAGADRTFQTEDDLTREAPRDLNSRSR